MSDLQKTFAKSRLAKLPPEVPVNYDPSDKMNPEAYNEHPEDDSSSASSTSSTGTIVPSTSQKLFERGSGARSRLNFAATPWEDYFETELFLEDDVDDLRIIHHVYLSSPSGSGPLFVTHHGAGSSGLSFATCAAEIRRSLPDAGVLSIDARDHGLTTTQNADKTQQAKLDLTLGTLSRDFVYIINKTKEKMKWTSVPPLVLVGHSLGGAVVTDVAKGGELGSNVLAYAVLDVVEGSAIDALQTMETYLSMRPASFPSLASGIEWHTRSRTIRNTSSARASVQGLLREEPQAEGSDTVGAWKWRTDLASTKPFWENWFTGLSKKFLEARGGKLLLLAGTDRLDKELIIGQMQGKYQLQVFPEAGHFIHEDQPVKTAQILVDFYKRNDRSALILPPKVSEMLASKNGAQKWGLK